jgi:Flp pilus assembly protein TadD
MKNVTKNTRFLHIIIRIEYSLILFLLLVYAVRTFYTRNPDQDAADRNTTEKSASSLNKKNREKTQNKNKPDKTIKEKIISVVTSAFSPPEKKEKPLHAGKSAAKKSDGITYIENASVRSDFRDLGLRSIDEGDREQAFIYLLKVTGIKENSSVAVKLKKKIFADHTDERLRALLKGEMYQASDDEDNASDSENLQDRVFQTPAEKEKQSRDFQNKGIRFYENERYPEALSQFKAASEISPRNSRNFFLQGKALYAMEKYAESADMYYQAQLLDPGNADYHFSRGLSFYKLSLWKKAADSFKSAAEINPDYAEAYYNLGASLEAMGDYRSAAQSYEKAYKMHNQITYSASKAIEMYKKAGLPDEAHRVEITLPEPVNSSENQSASEERN